MGSNGSEPWVNTSPPETNGDINSYNNALQNTRYSRMTSRRKNFSTLNRLYDTGVGAELPLPQICVLGSQSSGKSSLIQSISGVPLPRASGTCTRCPTQCILTQSGGPWSCKITLRFEYDQRGRLAYPKSYEFGTVIRSPSEVEERLRRAQAAILHPELDAQDFPERFLHGDLPDPSTRATSFSRNCISMTVEGRDVVDLSFIDLPGIIASVSSGSPQSDIDEVRSLAIQHIQNESGIVLLTITCETDFENQGAWQIGRAHDPNLEKTIGVLTKPDRIERERDSETPWLSLLRNEKEFLRRGWYCVKLPGPEELRRKIGRDEARGNERQFFAQEPWASMHDVRARLSVDNLVEGLAEALSDRISKQLPHIRTQISGKIDEIEQQLAGLPPDFTGNPINELLRLVSNFQRKVWVEIEGTIDPEGLIQKIKGHLEEFRRELRGTAPRFVPFDRGTHHAQEVPFLGFLDEQERDLGEDGSLDIIYLDEVEFRAEKSISRELPNNVPFALKREFIRRSILKWEAPCNSLFRRVQNTLEEHFNNLTHEHFSDCPNLLRAVSDLLSECRSTCRNATEKKMLWMRRAEEANTFTLSTNHLEDYRARFEEHYKLLRRQASSRYPNSIQILLQPVRGEPYHYVRRDVHVEFTDQEKRNNLLRALEDAGLPPSIEDLLKVLPRDSANSAIEIMADIRAYWQVAFKRFSDCIALAIDMDYVRGFGEGLDESLPRHLGATSPDAEVRCRQYFVQPPHIEALRNSLKVKLGRLEEARRVIEAWIAQSPH